MYENLGYSGCCVLQVDGHCYADYASRQPGHDGSGGVGGSCPISHRLLVEESTAGSRSKAYRPLVAQACLYFVFLLLALPTSNNLDVSSNLFSHIPMSRNHSWNCPKLCLVILGCGGPTQAILPGKRKACCRSVPVVCDALTQL